MSCMPGVLQEKTTHGTTPWVGPGERRSLIFKFAPFGLHQADHPYDAAALERTVGITLSPREAALLRLPEEGAWLNEHGAGVYQNSPSSRFRRALPGPPSPSVSSASASPWLSQARSSCLSPW